MCDFMSICWVLGFIECMCELCMCVSVCVSRMPSNQVGENSLQRMRLKNRGVHSPMSYCAHDLVLFLLKPF